MNPNVEIRECNPPVKNTASISDVMVTIAQVFWKGTHLLDIAYCTEDFYKNIEALKGEVQKRWVLYASKSLPLLHFHLGDFLAREEAEAGVTRIANDWEHMLRTMWFRPKVKTVNNG
jgi:hypothetical protein